MRLMDATFFTTCLLFCLHQVVQSSPLWGPHGIAKNIRNLPCVSRKTGEKGTCMFAFTCAKLYGTHLGTCIDRFYFGSCCKVPDGSEIDVAPPVDDNRIGESESTTTPRIRPAITQKPQTLGTTRRPPVTVGNVTLSLIPSTVSSTASSWRPPSTRPSSTSSSHNSSHFASTPSSVFNTSSFSQPSPTTAPPTLVTWTTVEEAPSPQVPINPQVSSTAPPTHRPVFGSSSVSITPPPKKPTPFPTSTSRPSSTTTRPTLATNKPFVNSSRPAPSSARPPVKPSTVKPSTSGKPPALSTTWVPVSVSTHAPSTTKKPTKKPVTASKPVTSTNPSAVNAIHVSSTGKPVISVPSNKPSIITAKPSSSTPRPSPSSPRPSLSSPSSSSNSPPSSPPSHSTIPSRPSTFPSTTSRPVIVSSTGKPVITSSWVSSTTQESISSSTSSPPSMSSSLGPSSVLPSVQTSTSEKPSIGSTTEFNSTEASTTSWPPEFNEVEFNMSNYKDVCGRRLFPEARVVGGQLSSFGKWPWQISLRQWRTSTYLHKCGAALLSENWAITAAHCVENVPPSDLLLRLGEHDLSTEEEPYGYQERRVQIVASHPQFDPRTFEYDLALLRFYEPVVFQPNIIPICVPEDETNFVGSVAYVTGWGRLYEDGPLPSILQEVSVPVINNTLCETMYRAAGYIEHIPEIFICAGWKKGGFDSCEGDSGGPMVIQRPDKRWLLAGVISWGIGCAEPNQPGVYTRISQFRHWINQILQF